MTDRALPFLRSSINSRSWPPTALSLSVVLALIGCPKTKATATVDATPAPAVDTIGPKPVLAAPKAFQPPVAKVLQAAPFAEAWWLQRNALPLVTVAVVVPYGSAQDGAGREGLAALCAEMMGQGAGSYDSLALSRALEDLGAELVVEADEDSSWAVLSVLRENLGPALPLLADVVTRPRFEAKEWQKTHGLWLGDLESRASDAGGVAAQVGPAMVFGGTHPYGHSADGTIAGVKALDLNKVKGFHSMAWDLRNARLVVAGAVEEPEVTSLVAKAFASWTGKGKPPVAPAAIPDATATAPRVVLVDRPGAAQTMLQVLWRGPTARDRVQPALTLVHVALGGSFTSRLNQNLREDKGYTYGARTRVPFSRGAHLLRASASVQRDVTGPALSEMLKELEAMAKDGPTAAEVVKARATARNDDVETWETLSGAAGRLGELAGLGLGPDFETILSVAREGVGAAEIVAAARWFDPKTATILAIGDGATVREQFAALGFTDLVVVDAEGRPLP